MTVGAREPVNVSGHCERWGEATVSEGFRVAENRPCHDTAVVAERRSWRRVMVA